MQHARRIGTVFSGAALALALLTACQAGTPTPTSTQGVETPAAAPASPTPTAVTCADITAKTGEMTTDIESAVSKITNGDVAGGTSELQGVAQDAKTLAAGIEDPELKTRVDAVTTKLDEITGILQDGMSWTETMSLTQKGNELQTAASELSKYCQQHG